MCVCVCVCVCVRVCVCVCVCVCRYKQVHTFTHIHTYILMDIYSHTLSRTCILIDIYKYTRSCTYVPIYGANIGKRSPSTCKYKLNVSNDAFIYDIYVYANRHKHTDRQTDRHQHTCTYCAPIGRQSSSIGRTVSLYVLNMYARAHTHAHTNPHIHTHTLSPPLSLCLSLTQI